MGERPNILLIVMEHARADCMSRYNHPVAETPHMDSVSVDGTTFRNGYSPCPVCVPARHCLMSGQGPHQTGVFGNANRPWDYAHTMAGELTRAGYQTIAVGKTHFHPFHNHLGFEQLYREDEWNDWLLSKTDVAEFRRWGGFHQASFHAVAQTSPLARPHHWPEDYFPETWYVNKALDRLARRDERRPFFLYLGTIAVHQPFVPPRIHWDMFIDRDIPHPPVGDWAQKHAMGTEHPIQWSTCWRGRLPERMLHRAQVGYYAYLAYVDEQIGRLLQNMSASGLLDDTLIIITGDHGEMLGDHYLWQKCCAYEGAANVPLITRLPLSWDGPRNVDTDYVAGLEDIMPTLCDAAGMDIPDTVTGRSLLPIMRGEKPTAWREYYHGCLGANYAPDNAMQYATDGQWKFVWNPITDEKHFFHLAEDPQELKDLVNEPRARDERRRWEGFLIRELADQPEGLSDGKKLIPGHMPFYRGASTDLYMPFAHTY